MHTILNAEDGIYVGMWVRRPDDQGSGDTFIRQFRAQKLRDAVRIVNFLNGGGDLHDDPKWKWSDKVELL